MFESKRIVLADEQVDGVSDFFEVLQSRNMFVSPTANRLLQKVVGKMNVPATSITLVAPSLQELDFPSGASHEKACEAGLKRGYRLCPPCAGLYLRTQYTDQPEPECLTLASELVEINGIKYTLLVSKHSSYMRLEEFPVNDKAFHRASARIVFWKVEA